MIRKMNLSHARMSVMILQVAVLGPSLLGADAARACPFASAGRPPTVEALRVLAKESSWTDSTGSTVAGFEAQLIFSYDVAPEGQALGILFPVSSQTEVSMDLDRASDWLSAAFTIDNATTVQEQRTRETGCQGCEGPVDFFVPTPSRRGSFDLDINPEGYRLGEVSSGVEMEAWLASNALGLGAESRTVLLEALARGDKVVTLLSHPGRGPAALYPISLRMPGALRLPFSALPGCTANPAEISVVAGGEDFLKLAEVELIYLDRLDRDRLRSLVDLDTYLREVGSELNRPLFLVEYADEFSQFLRLAQDLDGHITKLLGEGGRVTRLRALAARSEFPPDLTLETDPEGHKIQPFIDLRPDPQAHGASIIPDGRPYLLAGIFLYLSHLFGLRRRAALLARSAKGEGL